MYKTRRRIVSIAIYAVAIVLFAVFALLLIPERQSEDFLIYSSLIVFVLFTAVIFVCTRIKKHLMEKVHHDTLESGETLILKDFIDRLRFCYSLEDFYQAIGDYLEKKR